MNPEYVSCIAWALDTKIALRVEEDEMIFIRFPFIRMFAI